MESVYDTSHLLARAAEWRLRASQAEQPAIREHYLREAQRCEAIVKRSLEAPMFLDSDLQGTPA